MLEDIDVDQDTTLTYLGRPLDQRRDLVVEVWYGNVPPSAAQETVPVTGGSAKTPKPFDELVEIIPTNPSSVQRVQVGALLQADADFSDIFDAHVFMRSLMDANKR